MGVHKDMVTWYGEDYDKHKFLAKNFLTNALLYINNVNGVAVFEATYNREYDDNDSYCAGKVDALQNRFDTWYLQLDETNRTRFVGAVMFYMYTKEQQNYV
jgi:hypothetical protein